jgi:hypothetical protein
MASTAYRTQYSPAPRSVSRSERVERHAPVHSARAFSALERMEDEVRALEGMGKGRRVIRWILGILVLGALLAVGAYFYLQSL